MFIDVSTSNSKKMPRVLLPSLQQEYVAMPGVSWMWPDRTRSSVFDLSLAGMIVSAKGQLGKFKVGQQLNSRLDLDDKGTSVFLKTKIAQMSGETIGLVFESLSSEGRLVVEQNTKDRLVIQNMKQAHGDLAVSHFRGAQWFHGPFDTNFFLWQANPGYSLEKAIVEYDHVLWIFEQDQPLQIFKSGAATDIAKGYLSIPDHLQRGGVKISVGASWLDRLNKCLEVLIQGQYLPGSEESLRILQHILRTQTVLK
jgi:hypothetical protein